MKIKPHIIFIIAWLLVPAHVLAEEVTSQYLNGPWCFSHTVSGGEKEIENRNFVFNEAGTFSSQQSVNNKKMTEGFSYEILPGQLKLKPIFPGTLKVKSIEDNEMILNYFIDVHFVRGECR